MADSGAAAPKPSSSVKLVLLGEAAVGKVRGVGAYGCGSDGVAVAFRDLNAGDALLETSRL
jgi:hypothetical protein